MTDWQATGYARTARPAWDGAWMCGYCGGDNDALACRYRAGDLIIARCSGWGCRRLTRIEIGADGRITLHPYEPEDR